MKKYRTTKKQPIFKENLIVKSHNDYIWIEGDSDDHSYDYPINAAIKNGWLEEIQEPKYTENDLHNLIEFISCESSGASTSGDIFNSNLNYYSRILEKWLRQRNEKKDT
jgi:hypothetical protein